MNPIVQQTPSMPTGAHTAIPIAWGIVLLLPVLMLFAGMFLGGLALRDIRLANGRLGGAMLATLAVGLLPALLLTGLCSGFFAWGMAEAFPAMAPRQEMWRIGGAAVGAWLGYLMMRGLYRKATGWTPSPSAAAAVRSQLATAAIILAIAGSALTFVVFVSSYRPLWDLRSHHVLVVVTLPVLLAGLICGVLARQEKSGRVCAWICGVLFVILVLSHA